jgi:hypothetical protein
VNTILTFISDQAKGIALALAIVTAIVIGQRIDSPTETDALQASADIDSSNAAQYAAQHALVATKD